MVVITRFTVSLGGEDAFVARAEAAVEAMARRPGFRGSRIGRAADDPQLWTVVTEWEGPGAYRRALSNFDVRVAAVPLLSEARNEPSAFEVVARRDAADEQAGAGGGAPGSGGSAV
ncbi:antibiotic biosynthesis monooxygenase family protein [Streptomonospora litoralis]|uniref:Antibiotic biosynthesis monooxygenase n=1 Tax=Streptomonospora litoralis TaxID=2498135 RepID=A0A4P6PYH1_9ACTN|nr:antibiotic biosynthesis monooxygenase [Streptomonospora litoralis]QBI53336.1 Antibiotic biosynthesis monooxygenase [Streptomonospora litoralis]